MAKNSSLHRAKREGNDEFYTQLVDIENELRHYKKHFKNKIIFCNCDDPEESNFFRYFAFNFNEFGIKKLITTHFRRTEPSYCLEVDRQLNLLDLDMQTGAIHLEGFKRIPLKENGDFRSPECMALMKKADIVITNPPFSLFREYIAQVMKYQKKFIIIGNQNAITYKEIFPLIKENKIWLGNGFKGAAYFKVKENFNRDNVVEKDGERFATFGNVCWFTNLDIAKRHEELLLYKSYSPEAYPKYDNYDAIEVSKTKDIPMDYDGVMGVPITFLDKYNPDQFEILGMCENEDLYKLKTKIYSNQEKRDAYLSKFGKKGSYDLNASGVILKNGLLEKVYQRILIRHKRFQND